MELRTKRGPSKVEARRDEVVDCDRVLFPHWKKTKKTRA